MAVGTVAARFTGAPLIVASVCAASGSLDLLPLGYSYEKLVPHATEALGRLRGELEGEGLQVEYSELENS